LKNTPGRILLAGHMPVACQQSTHPANKSLSVATKTPNQNRPGHHL
jgi:hypothetical protein